MTDNGDNDGGKSVDHGDDVCLADARDLDVVDAFNGFYLQLADANARMAELKAAAQSGEVTVLLLARVNLAWDLVDARLNFLAANTRTGAERIRHMPALGIAHARLRAVLEQPIAYRRRDGRADETLAQARRLAERLQAYQGASSASSGATSATTRGARARSCRSSSEVLRMESMTGLGVLRYRRRRGARRRYE